MSDVELCVPGSRGSPSEVVSTTVPLSAGICDCAATSASSCAGVRAGNAGAACADGISAAAISPPVTASAPAGTIHRALRDIFGYIPISPTVPGPPADRVTLNGEVYVPLSSIWSMRWPPAAVAAR